MPNRQPHRALRTIVWVGRAAGWALIALAIFNILQIGSLTRLAGGFRMLTSVALGAVGLVWVIGLELFLRFFDRYLSRN